MARGGILHRVTPNHYNVYNEEETLVGRVHRFGDIDPLSKQAVGGWYGIHVTGQPTGTHDNRHAAARELMEMPGDVPPL